MLHVSRTTHKKAKDLYLTQNTFVLPPIWRTTQPLVTSAGARRLRHESVLFSDAAFAKLKHIGTALCLRASTVSLNMSHSDERLERSGVVEQSTVAERMNRAHEHALGCIQIHSRIRMSGVYNVFGAGVDRDRLYQRLLSNGVLSFLCSASKPML